MAASTVKVVFVAEGAEAEDVVSVKMLSLERMAPGA